MPRAPSENRVDKRLEGIPQRELNQARSSNRGENFAERTVRDADGFNVVDRGIGEIRVVPDVEEVRRETQALTLGDREILDQREVPVLLERTTIDVAAEIAKDGDGSVPAICSTEQRSRSKINRVEISIEPAVNVSRGGASADRAAIRKLSTQRR